MPEEAADESESGGILMAFAPPDEADAIIERLAGARDPVAMLKRLAVSPDAGHRLAIRLADDVPRRGRSNLSEAVRLARAASWLARRGANPHARARVLRAEGHIEALNGRPRAALVRYARATRLFERLGADVDAAITGSGSLQSLIYCGEYEEAFARAARARGVFRRHGDRARLSRLDSNAGNIYFRQDRFKEALACYERALEGLRAIGAPHDVAVTLRNAATCLISLTRYDDALRVYEEAREYCEREGLPLLAGEADYNIGYLFYLRGDYQRAFDLYGAARAFCARVGDPYHAALCDLDEAELDLEVNDFPAALVRARDAAAAFGRLHMRYERAKALVFLAIATGQLGDAAAAYRLFARARALFVKERNAAWPPLIDLYRAAVLYGTGRPADARRLAAHALKAFTQSAMASKSALAEILMARVDLQSGRRARALALGESALARLQHVESPAVAWQAMLLIGAVHESLASPDAAYAAYRDARACLERLRSHLRGDELKITFLSDKLDVYEGLVAMALQREPAPRRERTAFRYMEEAKSRGFADLIALRATELPPRGHDSEPAAARVRAAQQRLHGVDHQIEREATRTDRDVERVARLREAARTGERQLTARLSDLRTVDAELAALHGGGIVDPDAIRAALPAGTLLLEYYICRNVIHACIVGRDRFEIHAIGTTGEVRSVVRLLRFQLAKFRLHREYLRTFAQLLTDATASHLQQLHDMLIAPIRSSLDADHLVIVPHGLLHQVPFLALHDAGSALIDRCTIAYAPSASVHHLCAARPPGEARGSLVLGVGDMLAPHISREVAQVAAVLPEAQLFVDRGANITRLRDEGATARFIHIATHGFFRRDNPMRSCIRLGDGELTVADVYGLRLSADLVTLSGCGTGLNVVAGGDELVGLTRGFLYAGARAVLVSRWDVNDESTAEFMAEFYKDFAAGAGAATSLARAMRTIKRERPHPYYWAPFALVGDAAA
jgi:tetratricopeptide (TPR) repeat protein